MAKTKMQKRTEAKKNAEALKAKRKTERSTGSGATVSSTKKGKSVIPQAKKK